VPVLERDDRITQPVLIDRRALAAPRLPYLAGLDGLRAIAVTAVVLYHLDLPWIPGGFLGVDVFFVLSGFLITTLVLEEVEHTGRLSYRDFYLRRARRLLPALWLLLLSVSATALLFFRDELVELRGDVIAALVYVSNWWYIAADQSYFEFSGRPAVLQHLWSLAVEEQFYLVWPAVVVVAMAAGRRRVRRVAMVLALLSTGWMAWLSLRNGLPVPNDPSRVYYGTDTHAMGLLMGAALATVWAPWRRWSTGWSWVSRSPVPQRGAVALTDLVGVVALVGVGWFFLQVGEYSDMLYRGGFLGLAALTALVLASLAHPAGLLGRALAVQPLRYLGERSYGIYLWHWPVFMVTRPGFELGFDGWPAVALRVSLTLVIAEISYRFVEVPIRRGAISAALQRARERTPAGRATAVRIVAVTLAAAVAVWAVGLGLYRAPAAPAETATAESATTALAPAEQEVERLPRPTTEPERAARPTPTPLPTPSATATSAPTNPTPTPTSDSAPPPAASMVAGPGVSAFGDSVIFGAVDTLQKAGARVTAAEGLSYSDLFDAVRAAKGDGSLRDTVVLHLGNNGAIAEGDLRSLLNDLDGRQVALVTLHVPRSWEAYNNDLFARVARHYPNVRLLDWNAMARANPSWLYDDRIHLAAPAGREAYARWLLGEVTG